MIANIRPPPPPPPNFFSMQNRCLTWRKLVVYVHSINYCTKGFLVTYRLDFISFVCCIIINGLTKLTTLYLRLSSIEMCQICRASWFRIIFIDSNYVGERYRVTLTDLTLSIVIPLLDVEVIALPYNVSSSREDPLHLTFREGEAFQWPCSVTAGEGDQLQWLFNDKVVPSTNESFTVKVGILWNMV